jgi:rod shape-determining protein MreD
MRSIQLLLAVLLTSLLQLAVGERMAIFGVRPDLVVLVIVLLGLRRGPIVATTLGFLLGFLQDLLDPATLGMNMLAKSCTGYAVGKLAGNLLVGGLLLHASLVGIAVLLHDTIYLLAYTRLDLLRFFGMFAQQSLPSALYTAVCALVVLAIASALAGGKLFAEEGRAGR